jgi:hypothetical protein
MDPADPANLQIVAASTPSTLIGAPQLVEAAFAADLDKVLPLLEQSMEQVGSHAIPEELKPILESLWTFFKAIMTMRAGDFAGAIPSLDSAVTEFDRLGFPVQRDISIGMREYCIAIVALRNANIGTAAEHFAKTKSFLERAGKFSSRFEMMIGLMEPDALFVAGVQAMMSLDYANAKVLINQAAQASEAAAQKYFEKDSSEFHSFMGQAEIQRTFYIYTESSRNFNKFDFDAITAISDLAAPARKGRELLQKGDMGNAQVRLLLLLSEGFVPLLESIQDLAGLMQKLFGSTVKADFKTLKPINEKLRTANGHFSKGGAQTVSMVRFCDQLSDQVKNLERLARPDKKDFGKFAGVITCALFLPIFLVISWANQQLHIGLDSYRLLGSCLMLALVGGFGFGALRFKNFLGAVLKGKAAPAGRRS